MGTLSLNQFAALAQRTTGSAADGARHDVAAGAGDSSGLNDVGRWVGSPGSPVRIRRIPSRSTRVPTVTGHGFHCDARGGEELTDLGCVLNDVQRHAADNH